MYLTSNELNDSSKLAYKDFMELPDDKKEGAYWNNLSNKNLSEFKSYVKNYYINEQNFTCPYCQQRIVVDHQGVWDAEHIIPKDTHPQFLMEPSNLCVSCKDCNSEKSNKNVLINKERKTLPTKSADYCISHPNFDVYKDNIRIIKLCGYYLPLTDKGRATIEICGLLRFTYEYANYGNLSLKTKEMINQLGNELMNCSTAIEEAALLAFIEKLASNGLAQMTQDFMQKKQVNIGAIP
ncbi:HNH endonuclease [Escherichia coli]